MRVRVCGARTAAVIAAPAVLMGVAAVSGCGSTTSGLTKTTSASCAAVLRFHGRTYWGSGVRKPFTLGASLGSAVRPPCQDTNDGGGTPAQHIGVVAIDGVDQSDAIAEAGDADHIFIARPTNPPASVRALVDNPRCSAGRAVTLTGSGQLNHDTRPPYPVFVRVGRTDAAGARYLDWEVTVQVRAATAVAPGTLATLRDGGPATITAVVTCRAGRFVATSVRPGS